MKRAVAITAVFLAFPGLSSAGVGNGVPEPDAPAKTIKIDSITVTAPRRMSDIGAQKTSIEAEVLHEIISGSMADILSQATPVFMKSYGRATLSTVSVRGTSPSHTQVTWNGMKMNSPMLGMVDFSTIPSVFIDEASVYYGASSTGITGGGLGGAVALGTCHDRSGGLRLSYTQGISSFRTFDQYLKVGYGRRRWSGSTRAVYSTSANDFQYTNYYKKDFITDDRGEIIGFGYPVEKNRNGAFRDLHLMQEIFVDGGNAGKFGLTAWWTDSRRGIPVLNVDYREESEVLATQDESNIRAVLTWDRTRPRLKLGAKAGYTYSDLLYILRHDYGNGRGSDRIHAQSYISTLFGRADVEYAIGQMWYLAANLSLHQHFVNTVDHAYLPKSPDDPLGYDRARAEVSAFASVRCQPTERLGIAMNLRGEVCGTMSEPLIPAFFIDWLAWRRGNLVLKASVARNFRFPTLNDLYFRPGGNPNLKTERGVTYDAGADFRINAADMELSGGLTVYDSNIRDWILWRPSGGGYFSPVNISLVRSSGVEARLRGSVNFGTGGRWRLSMDGKIAYTSSVNHGRPVSDADNSVGKQLPYVPLWSSAVTGRLSWRSWSLSWNWMWYSERFTSTDNSLALTGRLTPYIMNNVSAGRDISLGWAEISVKLNVANLFNEEYESELSRPMAGRTYGFFITITPRFSRSPRQGFPR